MRKKDVKLHDVVKLVDGREGTVIHVYTGDALEIEIHHDGEELISETVNPKYIKTIEYTA